MGTCSATCGITKERANDLVRARVMAERVHPGLVWSRGPVTTSHAVAYDALVHLAAKLEALLPVRVHVRVGDAGECDSLYVLAGLHRPCLAEIIEQATLVADPVPPRAETYVRVAISPHGRFAVMQEVVVSCEEEDDGYAILFEPQAGVVDRRLQHIVKGLQGALRKAKLVVLDLAAVLAPIEGAAPSRALVEAWGERVSLWALLFEGPSPLAARACWLPAG